MPTLHDELRGAIRDVPDFPRPGILFKDITPVLLAPELFRRTTDAMARPFERRAAAGATVGAELGVTHVAGIESRGFVLGAPVAQRLGVAFVLLRKPGRLPWKTERVEYALEYGSDALECHRDAVGEGSRVLLVDDVLATGGTAAAACELVERLGGSVTGCSFLMVLEALGGEGRLSGRRVETLLRY